jgi:hypothetical protein
MGGEDTLAGIVGDVVMSKLLTILAFAALAMVAVPAGTAAAQAAGGAPPAGGGGGDATSYDFEDDLVQGDLVRPDGENLMVRRRGARESLIRIREHFINELLKSVENL